MSWVAIGAIGTIFRTLGCNVRIIDANSIAVERDTNHSQVVCLDDCRSALKNGTFSSFVRGIAGSDSLSV